MALAALLPSAGCDGVQSSLAPAGREAAQIAELFWWMAGGAVLVWLGISALALYVARRGSPAPDVGRLFRLYVIGGGVVLPGVVLSVLLVVGLARLPPLVRRAPEGSTTIAVEGEMWWWRVRYAQPGGQWIELANQIALPVDEPVQFVLTSDNVIHSLWIPSLGGKMDLLPGRRTFLALHPTRTGFFRGACAEYCGTSHAHMALAVQVLPRAAFERWLAHQASPAAVPRDAAETLGKERFRANGCHACHTVRGVEAVSAIGPDLTHVGSRAHLAAGALPNGRAALRRWMANTETIKPGAHMPSFGMLPDEDLDAMAAWLASLK